MNKFFFPIMTTPLEKIAEEKNGNYQSSLKRGGWGYPGLVKDQYISGFFFWRLPLCRKGDKKLNKMFSIDSICLATYNITDCLMHTAIDSQALIDCLMYRSIINTVRWLMINNKTIIGKASFVRQSRTCKLFNLCLIMCDKWDWVYYEKAVNSKAKINCHIEFMVKSYAHRCLTVSTTRLCSAFIAIIFHAICLAINDLSGILDTMDTPWSRILDASSCQSVKKIRTR